MHKIEPYQLWLGHVGDVRDLRNVLSLGIAAIVDLAANEAPAKLTRDLVYCRFPLVDGAGNPPSLLRLAIETTAHLIEAEIPTLVYCSAGMSRSPAIAAGALAVVTEMPADECLSKLIGLGGDVSPALWCDIRQVLQNLNSSPTA